MSNTDGDTTTGIELADVRTTADAAAWLHTRAAAYADAEAKVTSPIDARAYRLASETIGALASLLPTVDAKTVARMLAGMARDYGSTSGDDAARHDPALRRASRLLADTFGAVGAQLTAATRPRLRPHGASAHRDLGPQL